jgi:radical SAM superfamily enzyme YgiQ (UPF0313 family)
MRIAKAPMEKKILLIQPTYRDSTDRLFHGPKMLYCSLALPALGATLPQDWEREYCLEYFNDVNYESDASVIGISSMGYDILHGMEIAKEFKQRGKTVIFGGPQAQLMVESLRPVCDAVVHGHPGPDDMKRLLADALKRSLEPEYRFGLDVNFPFDYSVLRQARMEFVPVLSSVGCRGECSFCSTAALYRGSFRLRRLLHVIADLQSVRGMSRRAVFIDANIYNNRAYLLRLCEQMRLMDLGLQWAAQCTVDIGDDVEVLAALRAAGCILLMVGFESLSQKNLDAIQKPTRAALHRERARRIKDAGIALGGYFILGLDDDTPASFDATFDFIQEAGIALPVLNLLLPAPSTPMFNLLQSQHRLLVGDVKEFLLNNALHATACNRAFYLPARMTPESAEENFYQLYRRLSSFHQIIRRSRHTSAFLFGSLLRMNYAMRRESRMMAGVDR